jgi:hypothetical protein
MSETKNTTKRAERLVERWEDKFDISLDGTLWPLTICDATGSRTVTPDDCSDWILCVLENTYHAKKITWNEMQDVYEAAVAVIAERVNVPTN